MTKENLEDESAWEETGVLSPGRPQSTVVSVRFASSEIDEVRAAARRMGVKTSDFIRRSALHAATVGGAMTLKIGTVGVTLVGPTTETLHPGPQIKVA